MPCCPYLTRALRWVTLLAVFAGVVLPMLLPARAGAAAPKPNIVVVLIDDMGWADVGCNGSTFYETPNVDRLAREGMRFTNGYAACPVCSPTRAALLTGRYPARIQLTDYLKGRRSPKDSPVLPALYADQLDPAELTLAEALRGAGYATAHVGKWHLGGKPEFLPEQQGFDVNIGGSGAGSPASFFWPKWAKRPPLEGKREGEYLTDRLTEEACAFIEANRRRPFFLYLAHYAVHIPLEARADQLAKYEKKRAAHPPKAGTQDNPVYAAMVESVDESVGRLTETLRRLKLDENTIIVFTSDNGGLSVREGPHTPATINAPLRAGKGYLFEGGIRVPLIVRWPGVTPAGAVSDVPASSQDFFPTLTAAAGLDPKSLKTNGPIDGVDLRPVLRDPRATLPRDALYWHYPHFGNQGGRPGGMMRAGAWKLIEWYDNGKAELYNLSSDPGEARDLAGDDPARVKAMRADLARWRAEVKANMVRPNPEYVPAQ